MYMYEKIFFYPITIILFTYLAFIPTNRFKLNEEQSGRLFSLTILKKKNTFLTRFLIWAFGSKKKQIRIYYYVRWVKRIFLIIATIFLILMLMFKWYLCKNLVSVYYCIIVFGIAFFEGIPVVLISIHNHIVKKEKKKAEKQNNSEK